MYPQIPMISADDFYGSPIWDDAAQAEFAQRIRRVPKGGARARRFLDKAWALFYRSNDRERRLAAVALLERGVNETQATPSMQAQLLDRAAFYQVKLGLSRAAIETLRRVITLAPLGKRHWFALVAPEELLARLLVETGQLAHARAVLLPLHAARRWPPAFETIAATDVRDEHAALVTDPEAAADRLVAKYLHADPPEPAVPHIAAATRDALTALDRHFALEKESLELRWAPSSFARDYVTQTFVPALGAYLGRVLVRTHGGVWRLGVPLLESRVLLDGRAIDPFRAAYDNVAFGLPLAVLYDELCSRSPVAPGDTQVETRT